MRRHEVAVLTAIFLDLLGFGMAFPDIQLRAEKLGASGVVIGLILAAMFAVQLVTSPWWGRLSDRVGRKPVAVACTALSSASMVFYTFTDSIWGITLSRVVAGFAAANVVAIQAYIADKSADGERGPAMGRIGAAISVGLIAGPFLGGQLVQLGGSQLMGGAAAIASGLAALILLAGMSHVKPMPNPEAGRGPVFDLRLLSDIPNLRPFVLLATVAWFALACLEGTFGRLISRLYEFPMTELGVRFTEPQGVFGAIFGMESLVSFAIQGLLFAWISSKLDYKAVLRLGYILQGLGLLLSPFSPTLAVLFFVSALFSAGGALANPTINTICSNLVPEARQGELFGMLQASRSIGFLLGPIIGGLLFDFRPQIPYVVAGAVCVVAALLVPGNIGIPKKELAAD
jgi:DHA1 family multidrug resistance protein-like MFS transporter